MKPATGRRRSDQRRSGRLRSLVQEHAGDERLLYATVFQTGLRRACFRAGCRQGDPRGMTGALEDGARSAQPQPAWPGAGASTWCGMPGQGAASCPGGSGTGKPFCSAIIASGKPRRQSRPMTMRA